MRAVEPSFALSMFSKVTSGNHGSLRRKKHCRCSKQLTIRASQLGTLVCMSSSKGMMSLRANIDTSQRLLKRCI